jgi:hypothetical protein
MSLDFLFFLDKSPDFNKILEIMNRLYDLKPDLIALLILTFSTVAFGQTPKAACSA